MKLSIVKILSTAIALPLTIMSLTCSNPANAEQIDRTNGTLEDATTSVTDLNLAIPGQRETSPSENRKPSTPNHKKSPTTDPNSSKVATNRQSKKIESKSRPNSNVAINIQTPPVNVSIDNPKSNGLPSATAIDSKASIKTKPLTRPKLATNSLPPLPGNYLRFIRNPHQGTNNLGNPIYTLEAYVNGQKYRSFKAVSGTSTTQGRDRDTANNFAPLPDGYYKVSNSILPSNIPEVGKTFIPIYPQFETDRSDLGIHQDPSYNKRNGHDGTAGCIGLTTAADRDAVNSFITQYHPHNLIVTIEPKN